MKKVAILLAVLVGLAGLAHGANLRPLGIEEAAVHGATHVLSMDYSDLSDATVSNTALVITNFTAAAKDSVECVGMVLQKAFDTGNTNITGSCALKVGDTGDDDYFLTSSELASDGTEVWYKFGRGPTTITTTSAAITNVVGATTNVYTALTGASLNDSAIGKKVYTTATPVISTFTPNAEESLSSNSVGAVRIYFKIIPGGK